MKCLVLVIIVVLATLILGHKNPHWRNGRSTIVHLFEWPFSNIADECETFLSKKGYGGVQVGFFYFLIFIQVLTFE